MRRQARFLAESPSSSDKDGQHDVFHTLQETLEVLRDEAETSRDSNKTDDLWCHPFQIPDHPIEQQERINQEIAMRRKESKKVGLQDSKLPSVEVATSVDSRVSSPMEPDSLPLYERLSISGANTSGVRGGKRVRASVLTQNSLNRVLCCFWK